MRKQNPNRKLLPAGNYLIKAQPLYAYETGAYTLALDEGEDIAPPEVELLLGLLEELSRQNTDVIFIDDLALEEGGWERDFLLYAVSFNGELTRWQMLQTLTWWRGGPAEVELLFT